MEVDVDVNANANVDANVYANANAGLYTVLCAIRFVSSAARFITSTVHCLL